MVETKILASKDQCDAVTSVPSVRQVGFKGYPPSVY